MIKFKIADSHTDFLTALSTNEIIRYVSEIKQNNVKLVSCAVFTTDKNFNTEDIKKFLNLINKCKKKYKINLLLSIEDLGFVTDKAELKKIIDIRPMSVTLTWNYENQYVGGADSQNSITKLGNYYIKILEQNGILIDSAHLSRKAFYQLAKITKLPLYNSHSNIYSLKHHARNLTDKQIAMIVKSNGYLGVTFYDKFVANSKIFARDIAVQFDYLIKHFGYKNFGLGSDLFGIDNKNLPQDLHKYNEIKNLVLALKKMGYKNKIIKHLLYKNFYDFLYRVNKINKKTKTKH